MCKPRPKKRLLRRAFSYCKCPPSASSPTLLTLRACEQALSTCKRHLTAILAHLRASPSAKPFILCTYYTCEYCTNLPCKPHLQTISIYQKLFPNRLQLQDYYQSLPVAASFFCLHFQYPPFPNPSFPGNPLLLDNLYLYHSQFPITNHLRTLYLYRHPPFLAASRSPKLPLCQQPSFPERSLSPLLTRHSPARSTQTNHQSE